MEQHEDAVLPCMERFIITNLVETISLPRMGKECVYSMMRGRLIADINEGRIANLPQLIEDDRFIRLCYASASKRICDAQPNSALSIIPNIVEKELQAYRTNRLEEGFAVSHNGFSNPRVLNSPGNNLHDLEDLTPEEQQEYYLRYNKSLEDQEQQEKELKKKQPSKSSKKRKQ